MAKTLVIAEKPSVGRDLARVLPGPFIKSEGYLDGPEHVITWAVGHLVQLAEAGEYRAEWKKWRMADLPIVPERFKLVVRDERSKKQMNVIKRQLARDDVDKVVNACDAGREGELIFAYVYEAAGATKPVQRLWLQSMTKGAIQEAFGRLIPAEENHSLEQAARPRASASPPGARWPRPSACTRSTRRSPTRAPTRVFCPRTCGARSSRSPSCFAVSRPTRRPPATSPGSTCCRSRAWSTTRRSPTTTRSSRRAPSTTSRSSTPTTSASTTWSCAASWPSSTPKPNSRTPASRRPSPRTCSARAGGCCWCPPGARPP